MASLKNAHFLFKKVILFAYENWAIICLNMIQIISYTDHCYIQIVNIKLSLYLNHDFRMSFLSFFYVRNFSMILSKIIINIGLSLSIKTVILIYLRTLLANEECKLKFDPKR